MEVSCRFTGWRVKEMGGMFDWSRVVVYIIKRKGLWGWACNFVLGQGLV